MDNAQIVFRSQDILYLMDHRCPACGAPAAPDERGSWFIPFTDPFHSALGAWRGRFGYVRFACDCPQSPGPGLRVARLGRALLPLPFGSGREAHQAGVELDVFNGLRVAQALDFLARHADPDRLEEPDPLLVLLFGVAGGSVPPDEALERIRAAIASTPVPYPVEFLHPA